VEHFQAGHHRIASYVWAGGGPTVLLVHGWNGTSGDLSRFIAPLRDAGRRVVAIDLPAHGRSSGRRSDLPEAVQAVEAALRREPSIEAVIAHSFGVPATVLAASRGAPLPRAVLISGPISVEPYLQRFSQVLGLSGATFAAMRRTLRRLLDRAGLETVDLGTVAPRVRLSSYLDFWSESQSAFGTKASMRDIALSFRGTYQFPVNNPKLQPFAGAGLGLHLVHAKVDVTDPFSGQTMTAEDSSTKLGLDIGGGVTSPLSPRTDLQGELWYGIVSDVSQLSLKVGLAFHL